MALVIRPARPEDVYAAPALMYSSGVELCDFFYHTPTHQALDYINFEFEQGNGFFGYRQVTVAELDGKVVGTGAFYSGKEYGGMLVGSARNTFRFFSFREFLGVAMRSRHVSSVMAAPSRNTLYLANFGVDPTVRSQGIGRKIVAHQLSTAKTRGYKRFELDVATNNPRGQALYERLGMKMVKENTFSVKDRNIPGGRRMVLEL